MSLAQLLDSGPFRRADARSAGIGRRELERLVASGRVVRVLREVYLARWLEDDPVARAAAVGIVLPPGAAVCRETAAWLHGIDARAPGRHRSAPLLQVLVPRCSEPVSRPGVQGYSSDLGPDDLCVVDGVTATTPARTAVDLLRWAPPFLGLAALDAMAHSGLVGPAEVTGRLSALRGQRHVAKARRLAALCEPATESAGESWMRLRVLDAGMPRPVVQIPILSGGVEVYRLDCGYPELRVGFEYDGARWHGETSAQIQADGLRREDLLLRFGWTVVGATSEHVLAGRPPIERVVADLIGWGRPLPRRSW